MTAAGPWRPRGYGSSGRDHGAKAIDLTSDQTPFREDEKIRLRKSGARVQTFDQVSGLKDPTSDSWAEREEDEYDPPRVWPPHSNQMGLAMSRSIGDNLMSQYGVTAQAEVEVRKLDESMAGVIVATERVFFGYGWFYNLEDGYIPCAEGVECGMPQTWFPEFAKPLGAPSGAATTLRATR